MRFFSSNKTNDTTPPLFSQGGAPGGAYFDAADPDLLWMEQQRRLWAAQAAERERQIQLAMMFQQQQAASAHQNFTTQMFEALDSECAECHHSVFEHGNGSCLTSQKYAQCLCKGFILPTYLCLTCGHQRKQHIAGKCTAVARTSVGCPCPVFTRQVTPYGALPQATATPKKEVMTTVATDITGGLSPRAIGQIHQLCPTATGVLILMPEELVALYTAGNTIAVKVAEYGIPPDAVVLKVFTMNKLLGLINSKRSDTNTRIAVVYRSKERPRWEVQSPTFELAVDAPA